MAVLAPFWGCISLKLYAVAIESQTCSPSLTSYSYPSLVWSDDEENDVTTPSQTITSGRYSAVLGQYIMHRSSITQSNWPHTIQTLTLPPKSVSDTASDGVPLVANGPPRAQAPPAPKPQTTVVAREPLRIYMVVASTFGQRAPLIRRDAHTVLVGMLFAYSWSVATSSSELTESPRSRSREAAW